MAKTKPPGVVPDGLEEDEVKPFFGDQEFFKIPPCDDAKRYGIIHGTWLRLWPRCG